MEIINLRQISKNIEKGYLAISSILIISAVVLAVTISVSYLSIGEGQAALSQLKGEESRALIEGCLEDALSRFRKDPFYSGGTIVYPEGTCYVFASVNGSTYTFTAYNGISVPYYRLYQVSVNRDYLITLLSWSEN